MKDKELSDAIDNAIALITLAIDDLNARTVRCVEREPKTKKKWRNQNDYFKKHF